MTNQQQAISGDLDWIKQQLQLAIELEFSTLPLYLSSMFSLEVQNYTVYNLLRSVVMEEMVHMAIAANILAAIGGSPQFKNINIQYPVAGLPGGAEPDLHVGLAQLSKPQLKNFMRIEMPAFLLSQMDRDETYPTIAVFYDEIRQAIKHHRKAVSAAVATGGPAYQVGDDIGFKTIDQNDPNPVGAILKAIDEILEQGEGASAENLVTSREFEYEESHYARFAEVYYGHMYKKPVSKTKLTAQTEHLFFRGARVGWPVVINTLAVPSDGYAKILADDPNGQDATNDLKLFDVQFTNILEGLDKTWNAPLSKVDRWITLGGAVDSMMKLRVFSCFTFMRRQIPADIVDRLAELYPEEFPHLQTYTDLTRPVYYGPRFLNQSIA